MLPIFYHLSETSIYNNKNRCESIWMKKLWRHDVLLEKIGFLVTVNSNFLAAILGGVSEGVGCAIIMNAGGASGGEDALAIVLSKLLKFKIGIYSY